MWKKQQRESREEHGSPALGLELPLPSAAPHDMAGWQRASQSLHVSQTRSLENRSELFDAAWRWRMEKEGLFSPFPLPGLLRHGHSCCATSGLVNFLEETLGRKPTSPAQITQKRPRLEHERFISPHRMMKCPIFAQRIFV